MTSSRHPLDWYIEVCSICGCQLGPGIGGRTPTGRCVTREHWQVGGTVVRVTARPISEQGGDPSTKRLLEKHPEFCNAERQAREPEAASPLKEKASSDA